MVKPLENHSPDGQDANATTRQIDPRLCPRLRLCNVIAIHCGPLPPMLERLLQRNWFELQRSRRELREMLVPPLGS